MIIRLGKWTKRNGRKEVNVVNCMYNTVYFERNGTHHQYSVNNFLKKYKPKGE